MLRAPSDSHYKSVISLGVVVRENYLKSRMSIFDGVTSYCLENMGLRAYLIPLRGDDPLDFSGIAKVDGLVIWGAPGDAWALRLWQDGLPVVNCNNTFQNQLPTVSAGEPYEMAYTFLKGLQRRTIGFVTRRDLDEECRAAFKARIERDVLESSIFSGVRKDPGQYPEHLLQGEGEPELEEFLMSLPKPAALWCIHDEMAALVWKVAENLGINVPDELALLGTGDHPCAVHSTPGITTVKIPGFHLGYEAARLLHRHLTGAATLTNETLSQPAPGATLIERVSTGGSNPINRAVQKAWRLLNDYPPEGLSVELLIEQSNTSRVGFYKEFEKTFNMSPGKAIRFFRVKKAKEFLFGTDMPISQIAGMCGFSGESEFSTFFKRETGRTPREWRNFREDNGSPEIR